jgi:cAMP-specific phosphodiesterase 4
MIISHAQISLSSATLLYVLPSDVFCVCVIFQLRHFDIVGRFNATIVSNSDILSKGSGRQKWRAMGEAGQLLCMQVALKVADIGHCALPWDQHLLWLGRLEEEMFKQGDAEKDAGMPVSPLMDRDKPGCVPLLYFRRSPPAKSGAQIVLNRWSYSADGVRVPEHF